MNSVRGPVIFVWDNFGPIHVDRCEAVANADAVKRPVIGIELFGKSKTYDWNSEIGETFEKITLFSKGDWASVGIPKLAWKIFQVCRKVGGKDVFICDYQRPAILIACLLLRLTGRRVYAMNCSKFDDYERYLWREVFKSFFFLPYHGAISSGKRSRDYIRFLGIPAKNIATEYNTLSIKRIKNMSGMPSAPDGLPFPERHFVIVARLVPKKNLFMAIDAYARYCSEVNDPRQLHLCGSGPLDAELRARVTELGLDGKVIFRGFIQTDAISKLLGASLSLLLPSVEEQFGNVVIEALAMGLPVILSDNCGARDKLVKSGVNGFVIEPDNPEGMAFFMKMIASDENLWRKMSLAANQAADGGDVERFVEAVVKLAPVS